MRKSREAIEASLPHSGERFDVIVAGGGPAGIGAALASARCGSKTLLLEGKAFFGGVAAVSGWMPMNRLLLNGQGRGGVLTTFVDKIKGLGPDAYRQGKVTWVDGDGMHIHPDYLRIAVMELLEEAGCSYLLHSPVTGVAMQGKAIFALQCEGKYGSRSYSAQVYVDATGDGDVAYWAGVPMVKGREEDGVFMPVTLGFVIANVDEAKLFAALEEDPDGFHKTLHAGDEGYADSSFFSFDRTTVPGVISVNNAGQKDLGVIDATDIRDLNVAERAGLQVAVDFIKIAREKKLPGLEDCRLVRTGADLGVRETRRMVGEYVLTLEDAQEGKAFPDAVAKRYGTIDPGGLKEKVNHHGSIVNGHDYPYRCMLPREVDALLVAGRCASLTHLGLATCKSMGNMMAIGQAAGLAAALCAKEGVAPRKLDVAKVREVLSDWGVPL